MFWVSGLAEAAINASAIGSAILIDATIVSRLVGRTREADLLAAKGISLLALLLISVSVRVVMG